MNVFRTAVELTIYNRVVALLYSLHEHLRELLDVQEYVNIIHTMVTHRVKQLVFGIKLKAFYSERRIERLNGTQTKFKI
jgi:hypothetical protein